MWWNRLDKSSLNWNFFQKSQLETGGLQSIWNPPGIHLESTGFHLDSTGLDWNLPGIHLESTWNPLDSSLSTWNTVATVKYSIYCVRIFLDDFKPSIEVVFPCCVEVLDLIPKFSPLLVQRATGTSGCSAGSLIPSLLFPTVTCVAQALAPGVQSPKVVLIPGF